MYPYSYHTRLNVLDLDFGVLCLYYSLSCFYLHVAVYKFREHGRKNNKSNKKKKKNGHITVCHGTLVSKRFVGRFLNRKPYSISNVRARREIKGRQFPGPDYMGYYYSHVHRHTCLCLTYTKCDFKNKKK